MTTYQQNLFVFIELSRLLTIQLYYQQFFLVIISIYSNDTRNFHLFLGCIQQPQLRSKMFYHISSCELKYEQVFREKPRQNSLSALNTPKLIQLSWKTPVTSPESDAYTSYVIKLNLSQDITSHCQQQKWNPCPSPVFSTNLHCPSPSYFHHSMDPSFFALNFWSGLKSSK